MFPSWVSLLPIGLALLTLEFGHRGSGGGEPVQRTEPVTEDSYARMPIYPGW
jgi:hypothetical protein